MSWIPANYSALCLQDARFSMCNPTTLALLNLITVLLRDSRDNQGSSCTTDQLQCNLRQPKILKEISEFKPKVPDNSNDAPSEKRKEYDFIVIGAGSAGCVMANRLSENPKWNVLLLEAGIEEPKVSDVPALFPLLQGTNIDWKYKTARQKNACLAQPNGECQMPRGKTMGGSSAMNAMYYVRGNPRDYNLWAEAGNTGWSYDDVLPYFKKAEHNTDEDIVKAAPHIHGVNGNLFVGRFKYQDPNVASLIQAWKELGAAEIDYNSGSQLGVMNSQMTQHEGRRWSTNTGYIHPIRYDRKNLVIQTMTHVTKILFNDKMEAVGVEYQREGEDVEVAYANMEVILSAGAINSPKLLMLSGVGRKEQLDKLGIPVISDLPVGENLQDHVTASGIVVRLPQNNSVSSPLLPRRMPDELLKYINTGFGKGPYGSVGVAPPMAFHQTSLEKEPGIPDIQYIYTQLLVDNFYLDPVRSPEYFRTPVYAYTGIQIYPVLLSPKSRGYIRLNDTDPVWGAPVIHPEFFTESSDLDVLLEGVEKSLEILQTKTLRELQMVLDETPLPACKAYAFGTRDYWSCIIRSYTYTFYHPVGTCKMGPEDEPATVVNPNLEVKGVKKLRVVDGGVIPTIPRGNTNAPIIMIAEKAADIIKQKYRFRNGTSCTTGQLQCRLRQSRILKEITEFKPKVPDSPNSSDASEKRKEYDFIVIGAGSAGCVMANRLSENPKWNVLLLEAGIEEPKVSDVPALYTLLQRTNIDWNYMTARQKNACLAHPNAQCPVPKGKTMGGSSSINDMLYVRGNPRDYNQWAEAGNTGWSYDDVLPYFKKAEHNTDEDIVTATPRAHGVNGNLFVGRFKYQDPNVASLVQAWKELGVAEIDYNSGSQLGVMNSQMTQHEGRRWSTNTGYIHPIRYKRKNLVIQTMSYVTKILFNEQLEAVGVEYQREGEDVKVAYAKIEVILSAGVINSPKVLMLSGVGRKEQLDKFGIPVISDLPVGENLQNHVSTSGIVVRLPQNNSVSSPLLQMKMPDELLKHMNTGFGKGPYGSLGVVPAMAFHQTSLEKEPGIPDIQYMYSQLLVKNFYIDPVRSPEYFRVPGYAYTGIQIHPVLLSPKSRGYISLNDTDPVWGAPVIQPEYFTESSDLEVLLEGIDKSLEILQTKTLRDLQMVLDETPLSACKSYAFGTRDYWSCIIRSYTYSIYHTVGTCKMGPEDEPTTVVNPKLEVKGVKRLRVVDGAVIPTIPRGNTNAPIIMIAEKAADIIKQKYHFRN